jgi:hypothetical protein
MQTLSPNVICSDYSFNSTASAKQNQLQYLHSYMLSFVRRSDYSFSQTTELEDVTIPYEMYAIAKSLQVPQNIPDLRTTEGFPASFWLRRGGETGWHSLAWSLMDDSKALRAAMLLILQSATTPNSDNDFTQKITDVVQSVSKNVSEMEALPYVAFLLDEVNPSRSILISSG